ncbi:Leucine-rich repeat-containing protein 1 [Hondaea fermentalgiana]|uniref:Leucine-rich repeat-containing protein 1 n=1 Tax=Hondaea fermentalgiana TaxID=2315210 RepID=A0A2R5G391_9STRA|nr:Leucine-rich repeat-containing protein 1 [Hondaea fermentalgiana]|eukprot:GBG24789.1 Leucine-rich repeat-containing protein 1 [Hondaea fermentalgiana]
MKKRAAKVRRRREKQKVRKPLTEEEAAQKVQGLFRTRAARRRLRLLARSVYEQVFDEASGAYFFHNVHTGDVSWEAPKLLGGEPFDEITDKFASPHDAVMAYRSLAKDWQEVPDESSSTPVSYFVNAATNESTWARPAILERLANALELRDEMLGPDWREVQDPDDGTYFFHNTKTDETQWEPPNVDFRKTPEEKEREALEEKKRQARLSKLQKKFSQANLNIGDNNDDDNDEAAENKSAASSSPKSDSDASSGPPEALMVDGDGEVASDQASFTSSDSESIYISSDEEEAAEYSKRKRRKRERQRMHHLQVLAELAGASERERGEFEAKVRLKRFRKNKQTNLLNLSHLEISDIPEEIFSNKRLSKRLKRLVLSGNRLEKLNPAIKTMQENLAELALDANELVKIPVQTWYLTSLDTLDLRYNRLREISREKGNMTVLREMNIWEIGIETMQALRVLRLDSNLFDELPDEIGTLKSLEVLTLRANRLLGVTVKNFEHLGKLRHLDLAKNQLTSLPDRFFANCPNLCVLDMSNNSLEYLPSDIVKLSSLRVLRCAQNNLVQLPEGLGRLAELENLDVSENELEALPAEWATPKLRTILNQVMDDGIEQSSPLFLEVAQKRAMTQISLEHYAEAESDLSQSILQLDQPGAALLYYRGLARFKGLNDIKGALQDLNRSLELRPAYAPAQRVRAFCLLQMGHYRAALDNASAALDFDMYDTEAWLAKSMAQEKLLNLEDALASYQETVSQIMTQGRRDDDDDEKAVIARISPWSALGQAQYRWGLVLRDLERVGEAVVKFQDAADVLFVQYEKAQDRSLRKRNLGNWLHMSLMSRASTFQTMNRTKKARAAYEDALHFASQLEQDRGD